MMMDILRAKELLTILADGINPITGELLSKEDSCNQVEIVRALHTVLHHLTISERETQKSQPENAGKPWTAEQDSTLSQMFDAGYSNEAICIYFKRTTGSIASRLVKIRKIGKRDEFRKR